MLYHCDFGRALLFKKSITLHLPYCDGIANVRLLEDWTNLPPKISIFYKYAIYFPLVLYFHFPILGYYTGANNHHARWVHSLKFFCQRQAISTCLISNTLNIKECYGKGLQFIKRWALLVRHYILITKKFQSLFTLLTVPIIDNANLNLILITYDMQ